MDKRIETVCGCGCGWANRPNTALQSLVLLVAGLEQAERDDEAERVLQRIREAESDLEEARRRETS
jgi:hypothetical protein